MHEVEGDFEVVLLAGSTGEAAGARAGAAEVDAEHGATDAAQGFRPLVDNLRVHGAAVLGVRVSKYHGSSNGAGLSGMDQSVGVDRLHRLRLIQQCFEATGRSGDFTQHLSPGPSVGRVFLWPALRRVREGSPYIGGAQRLTGELAHDRGEVARTCNGPEMAGSLEDDTARAANQRQV